MESTQASVDEEAPTPKGRVPKIVGKKKKKSHSREFTEALLTAIFIALILRAFGVEAFKIPSGSMIPTLVVGDHIFVNKFIYGLRVPFTKKWAIKFRDPQRGETIVFIYPEDEKLDFIKRVVGVAGDKIRVDGDDLYINEKLVSTAPLNLEGINPENDAELLLKPDPNFPDGAKFTEIPFFPRWENYTFYLERLGEVTHLKQEGSFNFLKSRVIEVPNGKLFVMGDNRDNSRDSREWGFVPIENVKGKAMFIWLSWNSQGQSLLDKIRWERFGKWIR